MDNNNKKIGFALIVIVVGALLLADNLNVLPLHIPYFLTHWYTLFIFLGLFLLLVRNKKGPGISLMVVGGFFMMSDVFDVSVFSLWPALLIAVGVLILVRRDDHWGRGKSSYHTDSADSIDEISIFSGISTMVTSQAFQGGKVTTIFGGAEIDLSKAKLAEGRNVIDLVTIFGGSEIYVPSDWDVQVRVNPIFGGYSDERGIVNGSDSTRQLLITGVVLFGGGELKLRNI